MPNLVEYALFSSNAYAASDKVVSEENAIPIPAEWRRLNSGETNNNPARNDATGFLARAYKNEATNEIVIAYAGTTSEPGMAPKDWTNGNLPGASGFKLAEQIVEAAKLYLDIAGAAANQGCTISFAGHSLGGGLASLMALYFDRHAETFDQAPFGHSAESQGIYDALKDRLLQMNCVLPPEFTAYSPATDMASRIGKVSETHIKGEAMRVLENPIVAAAVLGAVGGIGGGIMGLLNSPTNVVGVGGERDVGNSGVDPVDLHSMSLLAAVLQSDSFRLACKNNPGFLQEVFKSSLNKKNSQEKQEHNFLNLMVQQQAAGNNPLGALAQDVAKFTGDLDPVASGKAGADGALKSAVYALAVALYYDEAVNQIGTTDTPMASLFESVGGGIRFKPDPLQKADYQAALSTVLSELALYFPEVGSYLKADADRYTLPTSGGISASSVADTLRDLMLGGGQSDNLEGGGGNDTLLGLGGADTLSGGAGNDTLVGGDGADTYVYTAGGGADTIEDSDHDGTVVVGGTTLSGTANGSGLAPLGKAVWQDDNGIKYTLLDGDLTNGGTLRISGAPLGGDGNQIDIKNFKNGDLNITLDTSARLQVREGTGKNVFLAPDYEVTQNTAQAAEGLGKTITVDLSRAAAAGEKLVLNVAGTVADAWSAIFGDTQQSFGNGPLEIQLEEGQTQVTFALLNTDDIDSDGVWQLQAAFQDADGNNAATNDLNVNFDATDEANGNPNTTRDIQGDLELFDSDPGTAGIQVQYDDIGNPVQTANADPGHADAPNDSAGNDHIMTKAGDDVIDAQAGGDDWIEAGDGNDIADGRDGNDLVEGGDGADLVTGDGGDDRLFGGGKQTLADAIAAGETEGAQGGKGDWIDGGDGADQLVGTGTADVLMGGDGQDILVGGGGDDILRGDSSRSWVGTNWSVTRQVTDNNGVTTYADVYNDVILNSASGASDTLYGGAGDDWLFGEGGDDLLDGGDGADVLFGEEGNDTLLGRAGNDLLTGDAASTPEALHGDDFVDGGEGDDVLHGGGGSDVLFGGAGNDELIGDPGSIAVQYQGDDYLDGEDGNDKLWGGGGADQLFGGAGDDTLDGDSADTPAEAQGDDYLDGEDGNDTMIGGGGADVMFGGAGNDQLFGEASNTPVDAIGDDYLDGEDGDDILDGAGGADTLIGGAGADQLFGDDSATAPEDMGDDVLDGGDGDDVMVGVGGSDTLIGGAGNDTMLGDSDDVAGQYHGADMLDGGDGDDTLDGGGEADVLSGGNGNDTLYGDSALVEGTYQGNDVLDGGAGDDTLVGAGGSDALSGGDGNDIMAGDGSNVDVQFHGNDVLDGGAGMDVLIGGQGDDTLDGGADDDQLFGDDGDGTLAGGNDVLIGGDGNDLLSGEGGDDVLDGGAGNDTLYAGAGNDTLAGGDGDDVYVVDAGSGVKHVSDTGGSDTLVIQGATFGQVTLKLGSLMIDTGLPDGQIHLDDFDPDDPSNSGSIEFFQFDDGVYTYADLLGKGIELVATPGDDAIDGTALDDVIDALEGDDVVDGRAGNDQLQGGEGNDVLLGGSGNDSLDGGTGDDVLAGGEGDDTYVVDSVNDAVIEAADEGFDTVIASVDAVLSDNVEELVLADGAQDGTGNAGDNLILGNDANNVLDGGGGADTMIGGLGDDTYVVDNAGDIVVEGAGEGNDTVVVSADYALGANLENVVLQSGAGDLSATGNDANNTLVGNEGNNVLDGSAGDDQMEGGAGNDTYYVDSAADVVVEAAGEGTDTVVSSVDYQLTDNVENLVLAEAANGDAPTVAVGNSLDNVIVGNDEPDELYGAGGNDMLLGGDADDWLDGETGADTMTGGAGSDTYVVDDAGDIVVETDGSLEGGIDTVLSVIDYTLTDNVENLVLIDDGSFVGIGNSLDNAIAAAGGDNVLYGMDGNDTLDGGAGADTMYGGAGNDTYVVDDVGDVADETGGDGYDAVLSTITTTLGNAVEELVLVEEGGAIDGTGNDLDNRIVGNTYANTLVGGAGNDTLVAGGGWGDVMIGGIGDDVYEVGDWTGETTVIETENEGIDRVVANDSYWLGANVEELVLMGDFATQLYAPWFHGWGNELDNHIWGNDGANEIYGMTGNDTLDGRADNDTIYGGDGDDLIYGGEDAIKFLTPEDAAWYGFGEESFPPVLLADNADFIDGEEGDDSIDGGSGNDELYGGDGNDVLYGGDDGLAIVSGGYGDGELCVLGTEGGYWYYGTGFLSNNDYIDGGAGDDTLDGGSGDDELYGGDGNDVLTGGADGPLNTSNNDYLDGGAGIDLMSGGTGDDTYIVDGEMEYLDVPPPGELCDVGTGEDPLSPATHTLAADTIIENADEGYDEVYSSVSFALSDNIEDLSLLGSESIDATGNDLDNRIWGNEGDNIIDGRGGDDLMIGGMGSDTYVVDSAGDQVWEFDVPGVDTVRSFIDGYMLGDDVENLDLAGSAQLGYGNDLDNRIRGNAMDNEFYGGMGNDVLAGAGGNDWLIGQDGDDSYVFVRGGGQDTIEDFTGIDRLILEDIDPSELTFVKNGNDLVISVQATGDSITLLGWISQESSVNTVMFCGGASLDRAAIEAELTNSAPLAENDTAQVQEDVALVATGNLLANDFDPDGDPIVLTTPAGTYSGSYGTLTLAADGGYSYALNNSAVQSLGVGQSVTDVFGYSVTDGDLGATAELNVMIDGTNDAPILVTPLQDQTATANAAFSWQVPAGSFSDVDQNDTLTYSATLADGSALPQWLAFDAATQTFSGQVPSNATGSLDIAVTASDGHGAASIATDQFRITIPAPGGGCDHGGDHHGGGHDHGDDHHGHDHHGGGCHGDDHGEHGHDGHSGGSGCGGQGGNSHGGHGGQGNDHDDHSYHKPSPKPHCGDDHGWDFEKGKHLVCVDPKQLDQHHAGFDECKSGNRNSSYMTQWIDHDLAVSRWIADQDKCLPELNNARHGADMGTLHGAANDFLGSKYGFGVDAVSLTAGAGTQLKSFKGLQEGMRRIG